MNRKIKVVTPSGIGIVSILIFFVILVFMSFSVLTLSSSLADKKISEETLKHEEDYLLAYNNANRRLKDIDLKLNELYINDLYNIENIQEIEGVYEEDGNLYINFKEDINDNQILNVRLKIELNPTINYYHLEEFKSIINTDISIDDHIEVFN